MAEGKDVKKARKGTSPKRDRNLWHPSAEERVEKIADRLDAVVSMIDTHTNERDSLKKEIAELQAKSQKALDEKARCYDAERQIETCRAWAKSLRDKLIDTIKEARQGKLIDIGNDDLDEPPAENHQLELHASDAPKWHARPCELDLAGPLAAKLAKNQMVTWGQVAQRAGRKKGLAEVGDLSPEEADQVRARLEMYERATDASGKADEGAAAGKRSRKE